MGRLPKSFFARPVHTVARELLGRRLCRREPDGVVSGRIVEVEVYAGRRDPASHAYRGPTARNAVMFGPPGRLYVYFTYGMHHCLNVVCGPPGAASAVLIRALEPATGLAAMRRRRGTADDAGLARGPGCVAQALGLTLRDNGLDLARGPVWISDAPAQRGARRVASSVRIGIRLAADRRWRYFLAGHPCVSGPRALHARGRVERRGEAAPTRRLRRRAERGSAPRSAPPVSAAARTDGR